MDEEIPAGGQMLMTDRRGEMDRCGETDGHGRRKRGHTDGRTDTDRRAGGLRKTDGQTDKQ